MSMVSEFKEFISKGNVVDLAVGVIIGASFAKIVTSIVGDILMPPIGLVVGGVNFTSLKFGIGGDAAAPVTINYGAFLQTIFDFLVVAFCVFIVVKLVNAMRRRQEAAPPPPAPPTKEEILLTEIRDLLKAKN